MKRISEVLTTIVTPDLPKHYQKSSKKFFKDFKKIDGFHHGKSLEKTMEESSVLKVKCSQEANIEEYTAHDLTKIFNGFRLLWKTETY